MAWPSGETRQYEDTGVDDSCCCERRPVSAVDAMNAHLPQQPGEEEAEASGT